MPDLPFTQPDYVPARSYQKPKRPVRQWVEDVACGTSFDWTILPGTYLRAQIRPIANLWAFDLEFDLKPSDEPRRFNVAVRRIPLEDQ